MPGQVGLNNNEKVFVPSEKATHYEDFRLEQQFRRKIRD